jgi:hypothetical protein
VKDLKNKKSATDFLQLIFSSFFRWWWAVITGVASIASWLFLSREGILLTPPMFIIVVLIGSALLFLALSTVYQCWLIYQEHFTRLRIVGFQKCNSYGGEHVFLVEGNIGAAQGTVIELKRFYAGVEITIALAEIMEKNSKGQYQANPFWISPGHLRDLKMGQFVYSEIEAEPLVKRQTLQKARDYIIPPGDTHEYE